MDPNAARYVTAGVGMWLFISAVLWPHTSSQYTNTWVMGIVTFAVALISIGAPWFRFLSAAAGAWVVISAFALPTISAATRWNNFMVGAVVVILSLLRTSSNAIPMRRTRTA